MAPGAETMVLPATSSVVLDAASAASNAGEASRPNSAKHSLPTSSSTSDQQSMDYTTPRRFRVNNVTLPASSSDAKKSSDNAVTPSTVGQAETPDSVLPAANHPAPKEQQQAGVSAFSGGVDSSTAANVATGGGGDAVSAAERVKMNSRSGSSTMQQQLSSANSDNGEASAASITPSTSIDLGPRVGDDRGDDEELASPPPVMKLNLQSGKNEQEIEKLPAKKKPISSPAALPVAAAPSTPSTATQNASLQQQNHLTHNLPPPTFLAAKISPLRSKSSKAKKGEAKCRGKTPPPPSSAIAAASAADANTKLLSPGMFLAPRTPKSLTPGMTPTNFASDFGKGFKQQDSIQYDPANSFAWLDTPGGQGLFSPNGGLTTYSVHNTPRGMYGFLGAGHTPRGIAIPDAELRANGDLGVNTPKQSMICISPLNTRKKSKTISAPETPMNFNPSEIFASPQSTVRKADIHMAENNINLDADLNALLQLAETTTPGGSRPVSFMSPVLSTHLRRASTNGDAQCGEPPSSLQLPIISSSSASADAKGTPQLSIRSSVGGKSATKGSGSGKKRGRPPKKKNVETPASKPQQQQYQEHHSYPQPQILHYHGSTPLQYYHHPSPHHHQGWVYPGQPPQYSHLEQIQQHLAASPDETDKSSRGRIKRRAGKTPSSADSTGKRSKRAPTPKKLKTPQELDPQENEKIDAAISAVRRSSVGGKQKKSGGGEDKGSLPRGVTMRPSGKWQAQLYYAGKSRYIGVFDSREKACLAYEISREVLKTDKGEQPKSSEIEANINLARKAAFAGVAKN